MAISYQIIQIRIVIKQFHLSRNKQASIFQLICIAHLPHLNSILKIVFERMIKAAIYSIIRSYSVSMIELVKNTMQVITIEIVMPCLLFESY